MADEPDYSDDAATGPNAVEPEEADRATTNPMPAVVAEPATDPVHGVPPAIRGFDGPTTELPRPDATADPDDETGYVPGLASDLIEPPTQEVHRDQFRGLIRDPSEDATPTTDNETRARARGDLGMLRRTGPPGLAAPTVGTSVKPAPAAPAAPNPTQAAPLKAVASQSSEAVPRPVAENRSRFVRAFWKSESFWQVRPPTAGAEVREPPAAAAARVRRAGIAAVGGGVVVGGVLLLIARSVWMAPSGVLLLSLVALAPLLVVVGAVGRPPFRAPNLDDVRAIAGPLGVGAALVFAMPLPWQLGPVRELMRPAHSDLEMTRAMLADRSDGVALAECRAVASSYHRGEVARAIALGLQGRPEVVSSCLQGVGDTADKLSAALAQAWTEALVAPATSSEDACEAASSLAALDRPAGEVEVELLACVARGTPAVQQCCGRELAARTARDADWAAAAAASDLVPDEATAAALLAFSFDAKQITDAQREIVTQAGIKKSDVQRMAFSLACAAEQQGASLSDEFIAAVRECNVGRDVLPLDDASWRDACKRVEERAKRRGGDFREPMCAAVGSPGNPR